MSQKNLQIAQRSYECFARGDIEGLLALFDARIVWKCPGPADLPTAGTRTGRDEVRAFFGTINELYEFEAFEPRTFLADGDTVVVLGGDRVKVRGTGNVVTEEWAHVFTIAGDRITAFQEYTDTAAVVAEMRKAHART